VLGQYYNQQMQPGDRVEYGIHKRVKKIYEAPDIEMLVRRELKEQKGRIVVAGMLPTPLLGYC
jgi:hypothetical protein